MVSQINVSSLCLLQCMRYNKHYKEYIHSKRVLEIENVVRYAVILKAVERNFHLKKGLVQYTELGLNNMAVGKLSNAIVPCFCHEMICSMRCRNFFDFSY